MIEKFYAEIHMLSEIQHPNFVSFIGVHIKKTSPFPVLSNGVNAHKPCPLLRTM